MTDPQELNKQIESLNDELNKVKDLIGDIGVNLSTGIVNKLVASVENTKKLSESLATTKDISGDIKNIQSELNRAILKNEQLSITRTLTEKKLNKAIQDGNMIAERRYRKLLTGLNTQLKINQANEDQIRKLLQIAEKEKEITEEKKKQNDLGELLKKKYEDIVKGFKDAFTLGSIIDMLFKGSENIANFRKELGMSYENAYLLNTQMGFVGNNVFDAYINGEKLKKAFTDLSKEMGFVVDYGNESLVTMTNLTGRLGMSNKEAAQLTTLSRMQSKDTEAVLDNVGRTVTSMNKQGKTAILLKDVMKDVANVSKAVAVSLGSNPVKIAEAVVAAKQLGTTLEQMESTANSLLDFQSSIEDELKAELLTGKQMNLERARAAALANDMKTLSEEIGKNEEVINAFASNNRLTQEATAKALGMNREQLAAMIYQQEALKIGAEGVRAKYGEQAYEQLKAQNAQEKFNNSIEKLKSALSSVVQIFSPIIDLLATVSEFVASIVSQWYILYPLLAGAALVYLPKMASSFANIGSSLKNIGSNFTKLFSKGGTDKAKETAEKAASAGDKAGAGGPKAGEGIKNTLKGISAGISSFGKVKATDILKLAGSALALVALTPAIPALLLLQFVSGKAIQGALTGIGQGLAGIGKALKDPRVMFGLGVATLAIMGLGKALGYTAPFVEAFGKVITSVFNGVATVVTAASDGIVKMFGALNDVDVSKLLAIGPALIGIGAGIAALGVGSAAGAVGGLVGGAVGAVGSFLGLTEKQKGPIETLTLLASLADPLQKTASSVQLMASALQGVSTALAGIDSTKLEALNNFATNRATESAIGGITSFLTAPIKAIGSVLGGEEGNSNAELVAAIKEVKTAVDNLVNRPITVNLDGKKVGNGLVQGSYKVA